MKRNAKSSPSAVVRDVAVLVCAFAFTADAQRVAAPAGARAVDQGSRIAFSADREGQSSPDEIYLMNAAGTGERRVTPTSDSCGNSLAPRWSPTGHQIVFHCFTPPHNSGIFIINPDGTGLRRVTPPGLAAAFASWSPDGRRIAFGNPDSSQVYVVNVDGSRLRQLTTRAPRLGTGWKTYRVQQVGAGRHADLCHRHRRADGGDPAHNARDKRRTTMVARRPEDHVREHARRQP
jgi:dipeptidyl aminopeptidase/acylaminoacyl peptidase